MLYGPPGTGKSTMAKILAHHCGYKSIEINASDERTGEKILEKIKNAITTNAHFDSFQGEGTKPVCLIVDEIDGAMGNGGGTSDNARGVT